MGDRIDEKGKKLKARDKRDKKGKKIGHIPCASQSKISLNPPSQMLIPI